MRDSGRRDKTLYPIDCLMPTSTKKNVAYLSRVTSGTFFEDYSMDCTVYSRVSIILLTGMLQADRTQSAAHPKATTTKLTCVATAMWCQDTVDQTPSVAERQVTTTVPVYAVAETLYRAKAGRHAVDRQATTSTPKSAASQARSLSATRLEENTPAVAPSTATTI